MARLVAQITKVPESSITPDTNLRLDLNVDSLQGLQIVAAAEQLFDLTIPDEDIDRYDTIRSIVEVVERAQGKRSLPENP